LAPAPKQLKYFVITNELFQLNRFLCNYEVNFDPYFPTKSFKVFHSVLRPLIPLRKWKE
jgi:hypothetical protein